MSDRDLRPSGRAQIDRSESLQKRIEACLDALDVLDEDLQSNLARIWEAEDEVAESRFRLEHAEQSMLASGVVGKNEAERRARLAVALPAERGAFEDAERGLRSARRDQEEYRGALALIQQRLKALELLVKLRA